MNRGSEFTRVNRVVIRWDRVARAALAGALALAFVGMVWSALNLASDPLPPCTDTSTSACSGEPVGHSSNGITKESMPLCPTEDSTACLWDAAIQGNGEGRSFIVDANERVTYLP